MSWSIARQVVSNRPLLDALSSASMTQISSFAAKDLARTAWSLARLRVCNVPLLESLAAQARRKLAYFVT